MNIPTKYLLIFLLISFSVFGYGQTKTDLTPKSFQVKHAHASYSSEVMPGFDLNKVIEEDQKRDKSSPWRFGYRYETEFTFENSGEWTEFPNGDRIWKLKISCPDAFSVNLILENFYLPEGAMLHLYNESQNDLIGAFTKQNNNRARTLGTELISDDHLIVEYFEPHSAKNQGSFTISNVIHGYRDLNRKAASMLRGLNDSGDCNYDILCPIADGWRTTARSVVLIINNGNSICSGALVNNTAEDETPYILTANHCLGNPANWAFRFNWQSTVAVCASTANSQGSSFSQTAYGAQLRASNTNSDFALVEINEPISHAFYPYFAGWDRTDNTPGTVTGIHHPTGDVKKISVSNGSPGKQVWGNTQTWYLNAWDFGTTEIGSSGSPLFNEDKKIIGQLFSGDAACNGTASNGEFDAYGRFAVSWSGTSPSNRLSDWLDPIGSGAETMDPFTPLTENDVSVKEIQLNETICGDSIYPLPKLTFKNEGLNTVNSLTIEYGLSDSIPFSLNWNGELTTGQEETITLDSIIYLEEEENTFLVSLIDPNGIEDDTPENNIDSVEFNTLYDTHIIYFELELDCFGEETSWEVLDQNNNVLYSGGGYSNNTNGEEHIYSMCLEEGCYTLRVEDTYGDGLYGSQWDEAGCFIDGDFRVKDDFGYIYLDLDEPDFGSVYEEEFCISNVSVEKHSKPSQVQLYPNPTRETLYIKHENFIKIDEILMLDLYGKVVHQFNHPRENIQLPNIPNGIYFFRVITSEGAIFNEKIIVNQ